MPAKRYRAEIGAGSKSNWLRSIVELIILNVIRGTRMIELLASLIAKTQHFRALVAWFRQHCINYENTEWRIRAQLASKKYNLAVPTGVGSRVSPVQDLSMAL
jgi:hypothetical protein